MKFKNQLVEGFTNRIDKIIFKNGNTIYRNHDFETVLNINGEEINLYNSPFKVVDNKLHISYTPSSIKKDKILESLKIESIEDLDEIVKTDIKEVINVNTMSTKAATYLFDNIVGFGSYAFNKSHSASYARLTYKTAFYKYYYPEKFYAISLKYASKKSIQALLREIINETDIKIKLPTINKLNKEFDYDLEDHTILFSPNKLKSIKDDSIYAIYNEINKGTKFVSLFDMKLKLGSLADKATIKQLGVSKILEEISGSLTPKIFSEFDSEINLALKNFTEDRLTEVAKKVSDRKDVKDFKEYFKLINTIKKNDVVNLQIEENNTLLTSIKEKYEHMSANEFSKKDENEVELGFNGENEQEEDIDENELLLELESLEKKLKPISEEDKKLIQYIENKYQKEIKEYYSLSSEDGDKKLLSYIENEIVSEEKLERFKEMIENKTDFTAEEQDEVNIKLFAEYNFSGTKIDLTNRTLNPEELEKQIKTYYQDVRTHLQSVPDYQNNEKIANLREPYYYIGKNPKIIVITENSIFSKIDDIYYMDKKLKEDKRNFTNNDGKVIEFSRYIDSVSQKEYKYEPKTGKLQLCDKSSGKTEYKDVPDSQVKCTFNNNFAYKFFEDLIKANPLLTMDDFAIMSYFPFNKSSMPKKMVADAVYSNKLKKLLQNVKPGMIMPTGMDLIKAVKGMHFFKREEFDTVYHVPYHFNFDDKSKKTEDQIYTKVVFFENPNKDFVLSKVEDEKSKKEIMEQVNKIKRELTETIKDVKNNTVEENLKHNINVENKENLNME
jgi:hypothetical protein